MTQRTLLSERLTLVPLADEHLDLEVELDADPEVMRYLARPRTREEVLGWHRRRLAAADLVPGLGFWMGFAEGDPIGWWILGPPHGPDQRDVPGEAELGYRLFRRHWRRGYASEGARALVDHGFTDLALTRVFAQTMAVNAGSRATMSAAGLTLARAHVSAADYDDVLDGAEHGEVEYELTRATWARVREAELPHLDSNQKPFD